MCRDTLLYIYIYMHLLQSSNHCVAKSIYTAVVGRTHTHSGAALVAREYFSRHVSSRRHNYDPIGDDRWLLSGNLNPATMDKHCVNTPSKELRRVDVPSIFHLLFAKVRPSVGAANRTWAASWGSFRQITFICSRCRPPTALRRVNGGT